MSKRVLVSLFLIFLTTHIFSQELSTSHYSLNSSQPDWRLFKGLFDGRPYVELIYGLGTPKHRLFSNEFSDVGIAGVRIGYNSVDLYYTENLIDVEDKFLFFNYFSNEFAINKNQQTGLGSELIQFGLGRTQGFGYKMGSFSITPYSLSAYSWSNLNMKEYPTMNNAGQDSIILDRYNKSFRFGTLIEGGLKVEIANFISLNAGYEASVIFPRHLVFKQFVSSAIEQIGFNAIENFVDKVLKSSPAAVPIVNFILKSAYGYGFYLLRRDNMNWPFSTETPLTYENFKFGITFIF